MQGKKESVLVFCSREICYLSGNFFAARLADAFEELGFEVSLCELAGDDDLDEKLEPYIGRTYRAIVDFNSSLPRMETEDGTPYLEKLNGPFFDYILDHPLFHYNGLSRGIRNLCAVTLDLSQKAYIERYYPSVREVRMLPLGAAEAVCAGGKEQECRVLFPGTYERPEETYELIKGAGEPLGPMMRELAARRIEEPLLPMEEAFADELSRRGRALSGEQFALAMNAMYPVDAYVRNYFRKQTLDALLERRIPVTVVGNGWEKYRTPQEAFLRRERELGFALSFERIARAHILLNVSPMFPRGVHDRILAGMANRAVVLTDGNPYLREQFADGRELFFYSLSEKGTVADAAAELIRRPGMREEAAERAYEVFQKRHTWKCRAEEILRWTKQGVAQTEGFVVE